MPLRACLNQSASPLLNCWFLYELERPCLNVWLQQSSLQITYKFWGIPAVQICRILGTLGPLANILMEKGRFSKNNVHLKNFVHTFISH